MKVFWFNYAGWVFLMMAIFAFMMDAANSAPQECAASAITLVLVVGPYCGVRAIDKGVKG